MPYCEKISLPYSFVQSMGRPVLIQARLILGCTSAITITLNAYRIIRPSFCANSNLTASRLGIKEPSFTQNVTPSHNFNTPFTFLFFVSGRGPLTLLIDYTALHKITSSFITLPYLTLDCSSLHCTALHYITLNETTLSLSK